GLREAERYARTYDGTRLEHAFVLGRETIDSRGEECLHAGRDLQCPVERAARRPLAIGTALSDKKLCLDECPNAFLKEERVPIGAVNQELLERTKSAIASNENVEELVSALRWQGIDPELMVRRLAAPRVLVLWPIVDEQQQTGRRQALDKAIEEGLRLGIDPVEVLEHDH